MIKFNNNTISDWNYGDDNLIKVYYHNSVVYYKVDSDGDTPTAQTPCFAVVEDISTYQDRIYDRVYNEADSSWYMLNNLSQYEKYGIYGDGRDITTYKGKLTVDDGYEYEWNGSWWSLIGETTAYVLPDVPFSLNYNARDYDESTHTIQHTDGQLVELDCVITGSGISSIVDHSDEGYITFPTNISTAVARLNDSAYAQYFNRTNTSPNMTIVSKAQTTSASYGRFLVNRGSTYNWMYAQYPNAINIHGNTVYGYLNTVLDVPNICSVRVDSNPSVRYDNYTNNTTNSSSTFSYGNTTTNGGNMFNGYATSTGEQWTGDFYWVYMTQNTLTDEQIQEVIGYNENKSNVPKKYESISAPEDRLTFETMEDALQYECPWVGMKATIGGTRYEYTENGWEEPLQDYTVDLNSQWEASTSYGELSASTSDYEFYQSFSNLSANNGRAVMYITIYGYTEFTFKVRSYAESNYDYVTVNKLDDMTDYSWTTTTTNSNVYYYGRGKQSNTVWNDVTFSGIDGGEHTIKITYGKDGSTNSYDDRGYVAIPIE